MQGLQSGITVRTDADWAGCRRSRKSTSGGTISIGEHCIKAWSKTQAVIAKSSAESELYGVVRGACEALGVKTLCKDLGTEVDVSLELDATAAKGILDRQGISKVRHIDVNCLWLQQQCAKKIVPLVKIPGEDNSADLMTKHLANKVILKHMKQLNMTHKEGRSETAAKLHSVEQTSTRPRGRSSDPAIPAAAAPPRSEPDFWAEKGEHGRWVRVHTTPRRAHFNPWDVPNGPGRKTRLKPVRLTRGTFEEGSTFEEKDHWQHRQREDRREEWIGSTLFLVDKTYAKDFGTDQRRQRQEAQNLREARAPHKLSWADATDDEMGEDRPRKI